MTRLLFPRPRSEIVCVLGRYGTHIVQLSVRRFVHVVDRTSGSRREARPCICDPHHRESLNIARLSAESGHGKRYRDTSFVIHSNSKPNIFGVNQLRKQQIAVFDSHQHSANAGSCIAQTNLDQLYSLCQWIKTLFTDIYNVKPKCFELSYIQSRSVA